MDNNIKLDTLDGSPMPRSRIPLSNRSNSNPPHYVPVRTRWDRKDSSEDQPSSHDSIYDAAWASDASSAAKSSSPPYLIPTIPIATTSTTFTTARPVTPPHAAPTRPVPDPNAESPLSRLEAETPFLYGHGTELAPILEQRSVSTLRTTGCNPSASDISSLLKHKASASGSGNSRSNNGNGSSNNTQQQPPRSLRRQNSFSLDDLSPSLTHHGVGSSGNSSSSKRRRETSEPGGSGVVGVGTSTSFGDGMSSGSNSTRGSDTGSGAVGVPRLRNTSKRHSPPVVETVDVHAYPQRPAYPPHQPPPAPAAFAEWLARHRGRDTFPYPNLAAPPSSPSSQSRSRQPFEGEREGEGEPPPFRGLRSGHGNLSFHPYMERLLTCAHPGSMPEDGGPSAQGPPSTTASGSCSGRQGGAARGAQGSDTYMEPLTSTQHQSVYHHQLHHPWTCAACGRPADQRWSLLATVRGQGRGARRGNDWCSRCAWRKMVYLWCCCEQLGM
ncbi:hypothetical protein F4820DRAFT_471241 [Hypoxylon rubiginosum]|uniref:Uncharacterized protein n=1 Tax=Hypoxylon rubiginosum TaxID=110542 RepID=A0ACB9YW62_9PEZI|nr:hypothetical protein F4820DRAFT_471241 [Hypoxylon rubiginosum]